MMLTVTTGGFMWALSLVATSSLTVALKRVFVFRTCGGCFSITKELREKRKWTLHKGILGLRILENI